MKLKQTSMLLGSVLNYRQKINRENYTKDRYQPKVNRKVSRKKSQMLAPHAGIHSTAIPQLRVSYSTKTEWLAKVIPKLKEQ